LEIELTRTILRHILVVTCLIAFAYVTIVIVGRLLQPPYVGTWLQADQSLWFLGREFDFADFPVRSCYVTFIQGPQSGTGSIELALAEPVTLPVRNKSGEIRIPIEQTTWHVPFKWSRVPTRNVPPSIRIEIQSSIAKPITIAPLLPEQQVLEWKTDPQNGGLSLCRIGCCHTFTKVHR
jgi:hypothetical protein